MNIRFVTDPLVTTAGAVRPALLLAKEFSKKGWNVAIVTTRCNESIREWLVKDRITVRAVGPEYSLMRSFPTLDAWARCLIKQKIVQDHGDFDVVVNTSSCIVARSRSYYAQGLMTRALDEMLREMPAHYSVFYRLVRREAMKLETKLVRGFRELSELFVANSESCASMYRNWGIPVDNVINPPLDCSKFKPIKNKPNGDYVLTNMGVYGKEGKLTVIKTVADRGVRVKVFGDLSSTTEALTKHPNVRCLGKVSDAELVSLYSNALFVLFAFSHEPFGYIPVESMACGTPVLTFSREGPLETVVDGMTGWLAGDDRELISLATRLWKNGYDGRMRINCRERALAFDTRKVFTDWLRILSLS